MSSTKIDTARYHLDAARERLDGWGEMDYRDVAAQAELIYKAVNSLASSIDAVTQAIEDIADLSW